MYKIFTDYGSNLPPEQLDQYQIGIIPIYIYVNDQVMDDWYHFDGKAFYDAMRAGARTRTSMAGPSVFMDAFRPVLERGDDLLFIGIAGGISGTVGLAKSIAADLQEEFPQRKITVIDSKAASYGEGLCVLRAAHAQEEGQDYEAAVAAALDERDHLYQIFTVDSLEYMHRGGRIYNAVAAVGNRLNVKPILFGDPDGHIILRSMNVGRRRSLETLVDRYRQFCSDHSADVGLAHADCAEDSALVESKVREAGCTGKITTVCYEPVTGSHAGPGTVALFFRCKER